MFYFIYIYIYIYKYIYIYIFIYIYIYIHDENIDAYRRVFSYFMELGQILQLYTIKI